MSGESRTQEEAFEWIKKQDWTSKKKANARYRWKKRFAPDTIKKRSLECTICYNNKFIPIEKPADKCVHYTKICSSCIDRLDLCPFCREIWRPHIPIMVVIPSQILPFLEELFQEIGLRIIFHSRL